MLEILLYPSIDWVLGVPSITLANTAERSGSSAYLFMMFIISARVVRSMDLMTTLFLGVMGALASFRGLNLKRLDRILFAAIGRRWISMPRLLSVAVMTSPSLWPVRSAKECLEDIPHLWSPCMISSSRSSSPCPSASRLAYGMMGWSRGTRASEMSLWSGRCKI
jgi:hypothetical protein